MESQVKQSRTIKDCNLIVPDNKDGRGINAFVPEVFEKDTNNTVEVDDIKVLAAGQSPETPDSSVLRLPEELLRIIFKCAVDCNPAQNSALLDWRLVCSSWKNVVDNYPYIMDKLWCTVSNIPQFLNSTIATKVKNLHFLHALSGEKDELDKFFNEIIPNVQGIMLDFSKYSRYHQSNEISTANWEKQLFSNLMSSAKNLKEIRIESWNGQFLRELTCEEIELVGNKVRNLYINIHGIDSSEIPILKGFLFSMPQLRKLVVQFYGYRSSMCNNTLTNIINNVLIPYFHKFPGFLKELLFERELTPDQIKTLLLATMKYQLEIDFGHQQTSEVNLCELFETAEIPVTEFNELNCLSLKNGKINLTSNQNSAEMLHKIGFCTKLEKLQLIFAGGNTCMNNEFQFFPKLKYLNELLLSHAGFNDNIPNLDSIFFPGIPTLDRLTIIGFILNFYANFPIYFPNLSNLVLGNIEHLPVDILVLLGKMEKLENMEFHFCAVTDEMFTQLCEIDGSTIVPAIATFKRLKYLYIFQCDLLTDACLIDGIVHSKTLLRLTLHSGKATTNPQFTNVGLNAISESGVIKHTCARE